MESFCKHWLHFLISFTYNYSIMKNISAICIIIALSLLLISCEKEINRKKIPTVEINNVYTLSGNKVLMYVDVIDEGGSPVTERGICISYISPSGEEEFAYRVDHGTGSGIFQCEILVQPSAIYRAYAVNKYGTSYGKTEVTRDPYTNQIVTYHRE